MKKSVATGALILALIALPAAAASATALPPGALLWGVESDSGDAGLLAIDASTGTAELVGSTPAAGLYPADGTFDHSTGGAFVIDGADIYSVNLGTGAREHSLSLSGDFLAAGGMAIDGSGALFITAVYGSFDENCLCFPWGVFAVDRETGLSTLIGDMPYATGGYWALEWNPADGSLYAVGNSGFYRIDVSDGSASALQLSSRPQMTGLAFDCAGVAWIPDSGPSGAILASASPGNFDDTFREVGDIAVDGISTYVQAAFVSQNCNPPLITVGLGVGVGDVVAGAPVTLVGSALAPFSSWTVELRSTPMELASGVTDALGSFEQETSLPSSVSAGQHTITLRGTAADGRALTSVAYITVGADGTLEYVSMIEPQRSLAETGTPFEVGRVVLLSALLLLAGVVLFALRLSTTAARAL